MTDEDRIDARLGALLAEADPAPDEAFVARVQRRVLAEERMTAARAAAWRRFAIETLGSLAVIGAFYLLWRMAPAELELEAFAPPPVLAAALLLLLWLGVALRPAPLGRKMPEGL